MNARRMLVSLIVSLALVPALTRGATLPVSSIDDHGEEGITFVVEVPALRQVPVEIAGESFTAVGAVGFGLTSTPGLPALPFRSFTIAVPADHDPVPRVNVLAEAVLDLIPAPNREPVMEYNEEEDLALPGFRDAIDRDFYETGDLYPELLFEAGPLSSLRQQRVFDLTVYPVRYDPRSRTLRIARQLEVRIDFRPRAGIGAAPTRLPAQSFERGFESVYRNTILNYESARRFRVGPRADALKSGLRQEDELRLRIRSRGPTRLTFDQLAARGLPAGLPIARLALSERRFVDGEPPVENFVRDPVPIEIDDANQNGTFDAGDSITFHARSYADRVGPEPYLRRFTDENVLWLHWDEEGGARLATRSGWFDPAPPVSAPSFPDTFHFEEDLIYFNYAPRIPSSPSYAGHEAVVSWYLTRHFPRFRGTPDPYCADSQCKTFLFPFALPDVDESQPVTVRTQMVSGLDGFTHLATFMIESGTTVDTLIARWGFGGHLAIGNYESDPFPASLFTRPNSSLKFLGERRQEPAGSVISYAGAFLDWYEFIYHRFYQARDNRLIFTSGSAAGRTEFRIGGFTGSSIAVYDVTDPTNPALLTGVEINGTGPYEVRFRDDIAQPRRYSAFARGPGELSVPDGSIELTRLSSIAAPAVEPDYIIVVPDVGDVNGDGEIDDFPGEVERLRDHRQSIGLDVQIARLSEIQDLFDGGLARPLAIRNYLRYAFSHWSQPPMYLLLAGDGSEDYRDLRPTGLNVVPTQIIFGPVWGDLDLELVACDPWYVAGLGPEDTEFDLHLDMAVGRLPAQSAADLAAMVDKTINYENFDPDDRWRAKTLTISDDAWSSTINFAEAYRFRSPELIFQAISDSINAMVESRSGIGDLIDTRAMNLADYCDTLETTGRLPGDCQAHFDSTGSPLMYQLISEGNVLMNYQGHANRHLLAHERMFSSEFDFDQNKFNNTNRPALWFIYACHPNHFNEINERVGSLVGGRERAIGELMVARPTSGLAACVGSTGFEWLPSGLGVGPPFQWDLNTPQWEAFFLTPPITDPSGQPVPARWILGEVVNLGKELYNQQDSFKGPIFTYCLLGDPALRVDAIPPAFEVTAADTTRARGARIESYLATSDTVMVAAEIRDEVRISSAEVIERGDAGTVPVDPGLWSVEAIGDPPAPERRTRLTYRAPLRPADYDIILQARDASGREMEFPLAVRLDVTFLADGAPIRPADFLRSESTIEVLAHSPVVLTESAFRLLLDGVPLTNVQAESLNPELPKDWRLAARVTAADGNHQLTLEIQHQGVLTSTRVLDFQVGGQLLQQVATYPNPFDQFTTITYQLARPADEVTIRIYTVSGRLVNEFPGPRTVGYSQMAWDGSDAERNQVANGLYIYRVIAKGASENEDFTGRLVRARR